MDCQILTDRLLSKILCYLRLKEKSKLIRVSKQFRVVINRQISLLKEIRITITDDRSLTQPFVQGLT